MNRRWIAVAGIVVAIIGIANIVDLFFLVPRWAKSANPPGVAAAPPAAQTTSAPPPAAPALAPQPISAVTTTAAAVPVANHTPPTPPPVQPGMHLERQTLTPSGNLRVEYFRDRQRGIRQIALQEVKNPANSAVLAQYKKNAWVVVSPDDEWVALNTRAGAERGAQLYHRVSASPLKYEVPEELRAPGGELQDLVWQSYLNDTEQEGTPDRRTVTIDATAWDAASHALTVSVAPMPRKDDTAPPIPWTCAYNISTRQIEPPADVAEGPADEPAEAPPNESNEVASDDAAAPENTDNSERTDEAEMEGEKFPATRQDAITTEDVNELPLSDIRYAINEMFARHGVTFRDSDLRETFSQFSWYQPREGVGFEDVEKEFSDLEKENLAVLRRCRDAKIAASHRESRPKAIRGERVPEENDGERVMRNILQGVADQLGGGGD